LLGMALVALSGRDMQRDGALRAQSAAITRGAAN
jgi:hypothetical protein